MQAARASGHVIPNSCWQRALGAGQLPHLHGRDRRRRRTASWLDIACNMPVAKGMHV
jgi:hypothetical protein